MADRNSLKYHSTSQGKGGGKSEKGGEKNESKGMRVHQT